MLSEIDIRNELFAVTKLINKRHVGIHIRHKQYLSIFSSEKSTSYSLTKGEMNRMIYKYYLTVLSILVIFIKVKLSKRSNKLCKEKYIKDI